MKKTLLLLGATLLMGGLSAESPMRVYRSQQQYYSGQSTVNCDNLNPKEMEFANLLSPMQKKIFCEVFDVQQREHAMEVYSSASHQVSADMAVEKVVSMHKDPDMHHKSLKQKSMQDGQNGNQQNYQNNQNGNQQQKRSYYY